MKEKKTVRITKQWIAEQRKEFSRFLFLSQVVCWAAVAYCDGMKEELRRKYGGALVFIDAAIDVSEDIKR